MPCEKQHNNFIHSIYDYYKTAHVLYIELLIERSEVKITSVF